MAHQSFRNWTSCALLCFATLIILTSAADYTCHTPTILERAQKHKDVPDVRRVKANEPVPISECSWLDRFHPKQIFSTYNCLMCPRWQGEMHQKHRYDLGERVRRILSKEVFGQDAAIEAIVAAIRSKQQGSPLVMHLVGDNGTGKTLTAQAITKALFEDPARGVLYIRGNSFIAHEAQVRFEHRKQLKKKISDQLKWCSNSLIIVDELEAIPRNTVVVFDQFLDSTFREDLIDSGVADPSQATFLFISDFGKEGSSLKDTPEEVVARAHAESARSWEGTKMSHLVTHIVPFISAKESGTSDLISRSMDEIFDLPFLTKSTMTLVGINYCDEDHMHTGLSQLAWNHLESNPTTKVEQYRGVKRFFETKILRQIIEKMAEFETVKRLRSIPLSYGKAKIILEICTYRGKKLDVKVTQPWCTDQPALKEDL